MTRERSKVELVHVHAVEGCGGVEVSLHPLLTSALHGGEWPESHPGRFIPGQEPLLRIELKDGGAQSGSGWFKIYIEKFLIKIK